MHFVYIKNFLFHGTHNETLLGGRDSLSLAGDHSGGVKKIVVKFGRLDIFLTIS